MKDFTLLNLSEPLMRSLSEMGFEKPSPIQAETIPVLLAEPTDFLGLAATGTGKTGAFAIPLLERMDPDAKGIQSLILVPTRELAIQLATQINLMGKHMKVGALPIYGGAGYADQNEGLRRGFSIIVGTPGRVIDHMERGNINLKNMHTLILDEADEMISMGFKDELEMIMNSVPADQSKIWLFSATMSNEVARFSTNYLRNPRKVQMNRAEMVPGTVEQIFYITQEQNKPEVLCKLIDVADAFYGIIFCQTKALVVELTQYLTARGYRTDCLHGDMDQKSRDRTMGAFRDKKVSILVATDVACRGLDVKDITHVVNYSIPRELDNYVHRIGRTGRIGKKGLALSLVTNSHKGLVGRIEKLTNTRMKEGKIPTRKEIGVIKVAESFNVFMNQTAHTRVLEVISEKSNEKWKEVIASMSTEEIVGRFISLIHPEIFSDRDVAEQIRTSGFLPSQEREGRESQGGRGDRSERSDRSGRGPRGRPSRAEREARRGFDDRSDSRAENRNGLEERAGNGIGDGSQSTFGSEVGDRFSGNTRGGNGERGDFGGDRSPFRDERGNRGRDFSDQGIRGNFGRERSYGGRSEFGGNRDSQRGRGFGDRNDDGRYGRRDRSEYGRHQIDDAATERSNEASSQSHPHRAYRADPISPIVGIAAAHGASDAVKPAIKPMTKQVADVALPDAPSIRAVELKSEKSSERSGDKTSHQNKKASSRFPTARPGKSDRRPSFGDRPRFGGDRFPRKSDRTQSADRPSFRKDNFKAAGKKPTFNGPPKKAAPKPEAPTS